MDMLTLSENATDAISALKGHRLSDWIDDICMVISFQCLSCDYRSCHVSVALEHVTQNHAGRDHTSTQKLDVTDNSTDRIVLYLEDEIYDATRIISTVDSFKKSRHGTASGDVRDRCVAEDDLAAIFEAAEEEIREEGARLDKNYDAVESETRVTRGSAQFTESNKSAAVRKLDCAEDVTIPSRSEDINDICVEISKHADSLLTTDCSQRAHAFVPNANISEHSGIANTVCSQRVHAFDPNANISEHSGIPNAVSNTWADSVIELHVGSITKLSSTSAENLPVDTCGNNDLTVDPNSMQIFPTLYGFDGTGNSENDVEQLRIFDESVREERIALGNLDSVKCGENKQDIHQNRIQHHQRDQDRFKIEQEADISSSLVPDTKEFIYSDRTASAQPLASVIENKPKNKSDIKVSMKDVAKGNQRTAEKMLTCAYCKEQFTTVKEIFKHYAVVHDDGLEDRIIKTNNNIQASKAKLKENSGSGSAVSLLDIKASAMAVSWDPDSNSEANLSSSKNSSKDKQVVGNERKRPKSDTSKSVLSDFKKCPMCFLELKSGNYEKHILLVHYWGRIVKGERDRGSFVCSLCDRDFSYKRNLVIHQKAVHQGIKRKCLYQNRKELRCGLCDYTTRETRRLRAHEQSVHMGLAPFKCKHCDFTTRERTALRDHTYRHFNQKPYTCNYCSYGCIQRSSIKFHLARIHGIPMEGLDKNLSSREAKLKKKELLTEQEKHMKINRIKGLSIARDLEYFDLPKGKDEASKMPKLKSSKAEGKRATKCTKVKPKKAASGRKPVRSLSIKSQTVSGKMDFTTADKSGSEKLLQLDQSVVRGVTSAEICPGSENDVESFRAQNGQQTMPDNVQITEEQRTVSTPVLSLDSAVLAQLQSVLSQTSDQGSNTDPSTLLYTAFATFMNQVPAVGLEEAQGIGANLCPELVSNASAQTESVAGKTIADSVQLNGQVYQTASEANIVTPVNNALVSANSNTSTANQNLATDVVPPPLLVFSNTSSNLGQTCVTPVSGVSTNLMTSSNPLLAPQITDWLPNQSSTVCNLPAWNAENRSLESLDHVTQLSSSYLLNVDSNHGNAYALFSQPMADGNSNSVSDFLNVINSANDNKT